MSATPVHPLWRGSCRILMLSSAVMAAGAAAVLALGIQDALLLRLGLLAALWAALLGAFAAAKLRREARSCADHADHLRSTYQLELEREVSARREHTLTVERELREQAEHAQRHDLAALRAEIAAMRTNLELLGGASMVERVTLCAESTRVLPLVTHPHEDSRAAVPAVPARRGRTVPAPHFGPGHSEWAVADGLGKHGVPGREGSRSEIDPSVAHGQRTVGDLLAAHGSLPNGSLPNARRRRSHANPER
ncbi:MAG: DUF6779 domain-containing protein [Pseudonocardiaceae bacterium]